VLVPFTRAVVPEVDLAAGRVIIDPPEGLVDEA
jgi:16S rRNA processing protein RimM